MDPSVYSQSLNEQKVLILSSKKTILTLDVGRFKITYNSSGMDVGKKSRRLQSIVYCLVRENDSQIHRPKTYYTTIPLLLHRVMVALFLSNNSNLAARICCFFLAAINSSMNVSVLFESLPDCCNHLSASCSDC
jgi:hypothetical protein